MAYFISSCYLSIKTINRKNSSLSIRFYHTTMAPRPVNPSNNFQGTNSLTDEAVTGDSPELVDTIAVELTTTSGIVVALETIIKAELEIVVRDPVNPGKLLFSGTSTELGSMISTVLGAAELLEDEDVTLLEDEEVILLDTEDEAALDELSEVSALLETLLEVDVADSEVEF